MKAASWGDGFVRWLKFSLVGMIGVGAWFCLRLRRWRT